MTRWILAPVVAGVLLVASCSDSSDTLGQQRREAPDSTPAPDATVGVDPELADFYTQKLDWSGCGGDFQCATMEVPLDYDDPGGDVVEIAVLRSPATGDERRGSLVVNPGGPGGSGVDYARAARSVATEAVLESYDIVGFDPRGVGASTPIDCLDDADLDAFVAADASPDSDEEIAELQEQAERFASGCESRSGELLPHVGTPDVARDMDVLRAVIGDEQLTYLGKSYGTYIGAVYADLFPDRVGRMVLDGAIDPALSGTDMALGQADGFERALGAFIGWCLDKDCSVGDTEAEIRQSVSGLLRQADAEPLPTGDDGRPLTESLATYGIILPLYLTAAEGYPTLELALSSALDDGDGTMLLTLADLYLDRGSDGAYNGNQNEAIAAVNCLDRPESATVEEAEASVPQFEEASPIFGPFLAWGALACSAWPVESESQPAPVTAPGAAPILVVGTTGDPATPYAWAESLAGQLGSGSLLTYEGSVHTAYRAGSDCVDEAVDDYLLAGTVPADGTRCS